jgi:hypothetical protein
MLLLACGDQETPEPPKPAMEAAPAADPAPEPAKQPVPAPKEADESGVNWIQKEMDPEGKTLNLKGTDASGKAFHAKVGGDVEVPDEFPKDVPIYPDSMPMAMMTAEGHGSFVSFKTEESQEAIYDYYLEQLAAEGWTLEAEDSFRGQLSITSTKDNRKVVVTVAGTEGDTRANIVITEEK